MAGKYALYSTLRTLENMFSSLAITPKKNRRLAYFASCNTFSK